MKKFLYLLILSNIIFFNITTIFCDCFLPVYGSPFQSGPNPIVLTFSPDGKYLATTNFGSTTVSVYSVGNNGSLTPVPNSPFESGFNPYILTYSPNGKFLAVANFFAESTNPLDPNNNFSIFSVNSDGSLTSIPNSPFATSGFRIGLNYSKNGSYLLVNSSGFAPDNPMHVYSVNQNGTPTEISGSPFSIPNCGNPQFIVFSNDGQYVYVNCSGNPFIVGYRINADGSLSVLPSSPFQTGITSNDMTISSNGKFLATANFESNDVSVFQINSDGSLTPVSGSPFNAGNGVSTVAFSPNNSQAAVGNFFSNTITLFDVDPLTGIFTDPKTFSLLNAERGPASIRYSPNGLFVAIAEYSSNNVSMYRVAITANITIARACSFGPFTFRADTPNGTGPFTFAWTGPDGFTANTQEITVFDGGPYTVTITDANGCIGTATSLAQSPITQTIREKYCND